MSNREWAITKRSKKPCACGRPYVETCHSLVGCGQVSWLWLASLVPFNFLALVLVKHRPPELLFHYVKDNGAWQYNCLQQWKFRFNWNVQKYVVNKELWNIYPKEYYVAIIMILGLYIYWCEKRLRYPVKTAGYRIFEKLLYKNFFLPHLGYKKHHILKFHWYLFRWQFIWPYRHGFVWAQSLRWAWFGLLRRHCGHSSSCPVLSSWVAQGDPSPEGPWWPSPPSQRKFLSLRDWERSPRCGKLSLWNWISRFPGKENMNPFSFFLNSIESWK